MGICSTSNRSGLPLFFDQILPELLNLFGEDNFEINILETINFYLKNIYLLKRKIFKWKGPIFPPEDEFINSDILLVPISKTGSRVRIINGFSLGCCVVAIRLISWNT